MTFINASSTFEIAPGQYFSDEFLMKDPSGRVRLVVEYLQNLQGDLHFLSLVARILPVIDIRKATELYRTVRQ